MTSCNLHTTHLYLHFDFNSRIEFVKTRAREYCSCKFLKYYHRSDLCVICIYINLWTGNVCGGHHVKIYFLPQKPPLTNFWKNGGITTVFQFLQPVFSPTRCCQIILDLFWVISNFLKKTIPRCIFKPTIIHYLFKHPSSHGVKSGNTPWTGYQSITGRTLPVS